MATRRHAFLCVLMFLVSASPSLAVEHNQIEVLNEKDDMSFHSTITFENRTSITVPPGTTLVNLNNGTAWDYTIPKDTMNVLTAFEMVNASGHYYQDVWTWSNIQTPYVPCTTNCSWRVDQQGFSVADVAPGAIEVLQFIVSWNGPYPGN